MKKRSLRKKIILIAAVIALYCCVSGTVYAEDTDDEQKAALVKTLSEQEQRGDLNKDGIINVFDLIRYKNSIIEDKDPGAGESVDANSDGKLDGKDISAVKADILKKSKIWSYKSMPKMDGSTSAIPLEAGLKSKMLGVSYSDAKQLVSHHKTHESFQMLLSGENDMIFTVPISEEQQKMADEAGVKLNFVPVAKEGFVFVVNKDNPVDSLTSAQIRDIYSGKITNWKEVGGNDEKIIPYQRNKDSGSQNYMTEFMEGYDLMNPPKEYFLGSMSALMDGLAVYDNAENAIGYSVYSYAAQMYENSSDTKFIAVDGIKPTRETMADGTYPLLSSTSIVYTDKATQNTKDFAAWAVSEEGQASVFSCGYVPLKDMEYPAEMKPYYAKGTGKEKPADYKPAGGYSELDYDVNYTWETNILTYEQCRIDWLADKELQKMINEDISKTVFKGKDSLNGSWYMSLDAVNGYINVTFYKSVYGTNEPPECYELNYDARNGVRIEKFSDLFYKNEDFVPALNNRLSNSISRSYSRNINTDFLGVLGEPEKFSFFSVTFGSDGPYFNEETTVNYQSSFTMEMLDSMIIGEYYDCENLVDEAYRDKRNIDFSWRYSSIPEWEEIVVVGDDGEPRINVTSRFHTDSEIEAENKLYDIVYEKAKALRPAENTAQVKVFKNRDYGLKLFSVNYGKVDGNYNTPYMFYSETGEQIKVSDIFGKSFEKYDDFRVMKADFAKCTVTLYKPSGYESIEESFNLDEVDMKYFYSVKASPEKLDVWQQAFVAGDDKAVSVYPDSYVVEYGEKKAVTQIKDRLFVKGKSECESHGQLWYECWDGNTNEKIGWICEDDLIKHTRFFDYKKYDVPCYGVALGDESGSVVGYTTDYVLKNGSKEVQWPIEGKWNVKIVAEAYNDTTSRVYECYDADDGDYYGWIPSKNLVFIEEKAFKGTANGSPDKIVYGYKSSYVLEGGAEEKQWPIEGIWNVNGNRTAKWPDGTIWYECYDADDGDYYGWIKKSDLTLE